MERNVICPNCGCKQYEIGEGTMFCAFCNENLGPAEPGTINSKIAVNAIALQVKIQDRDTEIIRLNKRIHELEAALGSILIEDCRECSSAKTADKTLD